MVVDGVEDFVVPPADEYGESFEVGATTRGIDIFERFFQSGETAGGVPDREVFQTTWAGDHGLDGRQGSLVGRQVWERSIG